MFDGHPLFYRENEDGSTTPFYSFEESGDEFAKDRHVAETTIDGVRVSTVFLVIDHGMGGGTPVLYETMIFGGPYDEWQFRYHTYNEAAHGHTQIVRCLREGREPSPDSVRPGELLGPSAPHNSIDETAP